MTSAASNLNFIVNSNLEYGFCKSHVSLGVSISCYDTILDRLEMFRKVFEHLRTSSERSFCGFVLIALVLALNNFIQDSVGQGAIVFDLVFTG